VRLVLLLATAWTAIAGPEWISIATATEPYQYFRFSRAAAIEKDRFDAANPHPRKEFIYRFYDGPAPQRTSCPLEDRPGDRVFWYSPQGQHLAGSFPTPQPSEYNVSARQDRIRGFAAAASFSGSAKTPGDAMEVVYFTTRACSDAGVEYGFARDLATNSMLVYWSTYANCANDTGSLCRKTDRPALGEKFSNVQQESSGSTAQHGFRIYGLDWDRTYSYRMFVEGDLFKVEVWSGDYVAQCSENEKAPLAPCTFRKPVEAWFPIHDISTGYIVAGTLGTATGESDSLRLSDLQVAK
jgi:hypothetical protein